MESVCTICGTGFTITQRERELYTKHGFEPFSECFACQQMHRMSFRNGRNLYTRTCDKTGEKIISMYAPEKLYAVYKHSEWYGDSWNALDYGRDVDFRRPFFEQLAELRAEVPRCALLNVTPENSDYCNMCVDNKNCYLVFGGDYNEDAMYSTMNMRNTTVVDIDYSNNNEACYWLFNSHKCYGSQFVFDSSNCSSCAFVSNCIGCTDCILCTNLNNATYCIRNEQLSREEYEAEKEKLLDGTYMQQQANLAEHMEQRAERIVKCRFAVSCEASTGDYLTNCKNAQNCFFAWDCEDACNVILGDKANDCFHCSYLGHCGTEECFCQVSAIGGKQCRFSYFCIDTYRAEYCDTVQNCKFVFGCISLRHNEYCILNKQYEKEEYEALREKIVDHMKATREWGQFMPKSHSCFAYNESTAYEYYPLNKNEALTRGFSWKDDIDQPVEAEKTIPAGRLPEHISDIPDDVLNWAIVCEDSGKPFKMIRRELDFYRQHNIPLPRLHPSVRYRKRMDLMNPFTLHERACAKCGEGMQTTYNSERTEVVYCEKCYLGEVY